MSDSIALVTGASRGIGKTTAVALAAAGYSLVLAARHRDALDEVRLEIASLGRAVIAFPCDVAVETEVKDLFVEIRKRFGRLDLLFNNAGIAQRRDPIEEVRTDDWLRVVGTNLNGAFFCTREAFLLMKEQKPRGGRIINNGSVSAQMPRPNAIAYTATKHALTGLTKGTSLEGRRYNIACGQIDIGNALTDLSKATFQGILQADDVIRPEPTMDVLDVARAIVYMASLPLEANVQFMTVVATKMPYVGRG